MEKATSTLMISFFKRSPKSFPPLTTDLHSHLLPELDDGVKTWAESLDIIQTLSTLGYTKLITTPHINSEYFRNEPVSIYQKLNQLQALLTQKQIPMQIEAAAEYYLNEELLRKVQVKEPLMTFGHSYLLFETNFLTEPYQLKDFIFQIITQGYKPILAHPERYAYMTLEKAEELRDRGVLLQVNVLSLLGYYAKPIQNLAAHLIDAGLIDILGSDCHNLHQAAILEKAKENKFYRKALALPLLNNNL